MTRGTDSIYGSGNRSALQHTNADRRGRPGEPLRANATVSPDPHNSSTDKYYANQNAPKTPMPEAELKAPVIREGVARFVLKSEVDVNEVRDQAILALHKEARVVITVTGDNVESLERLLRTQMNLAVTRERITEGQYREMYFTAGVEMTDAESLIDDIPEAEDDGDPMANDIEDFDEFVKGKQVGVDPGHPDGDQTVVVGPYELTPTAFETKETLEVPPPGTVVLNDDTRPGQPDLKLPMSSKTLPGRSPLAPDIDFEEEQRLMAKEREVSAQLRREQVLRGEVPPATVMEAADRDAYVALTKAAEGTTEENDEAQEPAAELDEVPPVQAPPRRKPRQNQG